MAVNKSEFALHFANDSGEVTSVLPGDTIPSWAKVTNPYVTGDDEPTGMRLPNDAAVGGTDDPPAKAGKGSGKEAWADYAEAHGVSVSDDASRDEIIAACESAGVPVE